MKRVEAEHSAKLVNAAEWPAGMTVKADVCGQGQYVTVQMVVPGFTPVRWKLRRPVGNFVLTELRSEAERLLRDGIAKCSYPDGPNDVCSDSVWLAETLRRIDRLTLVNLVAKGVAVRAAISIEADGLPVPVVLDWQHISVILRWKNRGHELEVSGDCNGNLSVCLQVPGMPLLINSWPCLNLPRGKSCVAYDRARTVVYDLFEKQVIGPVGVIW